MACVVREPHPRRLRGLGSAGSRAAWIVVLSALASAGWGAAYPERPVRLIVGFSPGGGTDIVARLLAQSLSDSWGRAVVVDNRPGADGSIGTAIVAQAPADGHTLAMVTNAHVITPHTLRLPYDPVRDFAAITQVASVPNLLIVHPSVPARGVRELVALAKAAPGSLRFGSSGRGTTPYVAMEKFRQMAGLDLVHVPYKGSSPALLALLTGDVQLMFGGVSVTLPRHREGKVRAIAVSSRERNAAAPEIPTVAESGLAGFEAYTWYAWLAPARTPPAVVERINADVVRAIGSPPVRAALHRQGFTPIAGSPSDAARVIRAEIADWGRVLRDAR